MNIIGALARVAPIILLIIIGMIFRGTRFLQPETIEDINKLVVKVALPSLLYLSFSRMVFETRYLAVVIAMFLACCLMLAAGGLFRSLLSPENLYYPALFSAYEIGMMGYALFIPVFGIENTDKLAVVQLGNSLFVFFILITFIQKQSGSRLSPGKQLTVFIKTPLIIAVLLGILVSVSGVNEAISKSIVGSALLELINLLASLTVPLIVLSIGYQLKLDRKNPGLLRLAVITTLIRLALSLLLATAINYLLIDRLLQLDPLFQAAVYTAFLLPPPFPIPIYMPSTANDSHRQEIVTTISVHILISLAAFVAFVVLRQI